MAIDPHYIPAFTLEEVFLDKDDGQPLSGGIVTFERSLQPGTLKPVYQITGTDPNFTYTQLPNPLILSSIGTFEDTMGNPVVPYFLPYNSDFTPDYYRVIVESSGLVPQFVRDPVPYIPSSGSSNFSSAYENEISNPQFSEVLFDTSTPTYVYSFNAVSQEVVNIAPDWDLIVTSPGIGTVTVSQVTPTGSLNILTNPGTLLNINSAGLSRLRLRQRIYGSPNLWGSGYLGVSFIAKTYAGTSSTVTMYYSQSDGSVVDEILVTAILNGDGTYAAHPGSVLIPTSDSTESFPDAYIDIEFDLPLSTRLDISSVMVVATGDISVPDMVYDQETQNRQIDHLFHYYQPQINFKPIPSMLVGWDFTLNPAQFGNTGNVTGTSAYIWDQTIAVRGATNIAYARNFVTGGIQFTTAGAVPDAFLMCQYLSGPEAINIIGKKLSVNLNAYRGSAGGAITYRIYLFRGSTAAVFPTLGNLIGALNSNGEFTKNNTAGQGLNWTEIPRSNMGAVSGLLSTVTTDDQIASLDNDYGFSGWEVTDTAQIADTNKFCIIVTFSYAAASTVVTVDSCSLVPGDIPTRPAPKTWNQTLEECQYYYETSYVPAIVPGTVASNAIVATQGADHSGGNARGWGTSFHTQFGTIKRAATPVVHLYSPDTGAIDTVTMDVYTAATQRGSAVVPTTNWNINSGDRGFTGIANVSTDLVTGATATATRPFSNIFYHFSADARLGIV